MISCFSDTLSDQQCICPRRPSVKFITLCLKMECSVPRNAKFQCTRSCRYPICMWSNAWKVWNPVAMSRNSSPGAIIIGFWQTKALSIWGNDSTCPKKSFQLLWWKLQLSNRVSLQLRNQPSPLDLAEDGPCNENVHNCGFIPLVFRISSLVSCSHLNWKSILLKNLVFGQL